MRRGAYHSQMLKRLVRDGGASTPFQEIGRILRYLAVGLATVAVFFSVLHLLSMLFPALPAPFATGISIATSGIVNFFGHRHFTFTSRRSLMESLPRYCLLVGFNSALGAGIVAVLSGGLAVPLLVANAVSLVAITAIAYLLLQKLVI